MGLSVLVLFGYFILAQGGNIDREPRLFGYSYTKTEIVPKMITSLIPSSCVQLEPSLPPCRNVRNLDTFPSFLNGRVKQDNHLESTVLPMVHTTPLGWGEYLGIYAPTVTVTAIHIETTTVQDPQTVVTFSVKGCKPSHLPMGLHLCEDIKPTPASIITPTATVPPNEMDLKPPAEIHPAEEPITIDTNKLEETQRLNLRKM